MTNQEMEKILKKAASKLPEPKTDFSDIVEKTKTSQRRNKKALTLKPVFITLVLCLLLGAGVYATQTTCTGAWLRYTSKTKVEQKYDITLRENWGEYSLKDTTKMVNAPHQYQNYFVAFFHKVYEWESINYYAQDNQSLLSMSIGKTDNELWKYVFNYMDDGKTYDIENLKIKYEYEILEHEVFKYHDRSLLYLEKTSRTYDNFQESYITRNSMSIEWIDYQEGFVVSMDADKNTISKEQFLEYAATFIDDYIKN
ncbi:MAG: hypothetical protein IIV45_07100 [Lachnospiraceae bacterium]|nr:hypothetical protein [Lachnospiraceae bacterium]